MSKVKYETSLEEGAALSQRHEGEMGPAAQGARAVFISIGEIPSEPENTRILGLLCGGECHILVL